MVAVISVLLDRAGCDIDHESDERTLNRKETMACAITVRRMLRERDRHVGDLERHADDEREIHESPDSPACSSPGKFRPLGRGASA